MTSEREELRREFSFENAIPNGPWYTFDTEKALGEIAALRSQLAAAKKALGSDTGSDCVICGTRIYGTMIGAGDGSGQRFAHPACYYHQQLTTAERALDEWKRQYFLVADAVAPQSNSAEHLANIARETRREREKAQLELSYYKAKFPWHRGDDGVPDVPVLQQRYDALRHRAEQAERARGEADEALAACQAQASGEIAALTVQLTGMTEARDIWQSEAGIQQAHRERAEKALKRIAEMPRKSSDGFPYSASAIEADMRAVALGITPPTQDTP